MSWFNAHDSSVMELMSRERVNALLSSAATPGRTEVLVVTPRAITEQRSARRACCVVARALYRRMLTAVSMRHGAPVNTHRAGIVLVVGSMMLAGCASYQPPPLSVPHPAHPDAPAARVAPPSQTLAYTRADIEALRATPPGESQRADEARPGDARPSKTVVGEGEVISIVPTSGQVVVDHGEIKGFMDAMTMGYRTDPPSLLATVKPGDKIRFTIDVDRRAIVHIEKLP